MQHFVSESEAFFFFNDTATTEIYTLSLHDALPISMVPSSFMISQITAAGLQPARAAKSQPASVWPARMSTPPSTACSGKMWPGWTRSVGLESLATAEMPVVTPSAASMETVKAVLYTVPLRAAFTVSIEAAEGVTTGISAADRART